jgi:PilZ domain
MKISPKLLHARKNNLLLLTQLKPYGPGQGISTISLSNDVRQLEQFISLKPRTLIMPHYSARLQQTELVSLTPTYRDRTSGVNVDRRRCPRFRLRLPVLTQWTDQDGHVRYGGGFSRDISVRGVFVLSSMAPPGATTICITVVLPNLRTDLQDLQLHSMGTVARVDKTAEAIAGCAIECDFRGIEGIVG